MEEYDAHHDAPSAVVQARTAHMLRAFLSSIQNHDLAGLQKSLTSEARAIFDGGGEFVAPIPPVCGAPRVARVLLKFAAGSEPLRFAFLMLNGLPAALGISPGRARWASRFVVMIEARSDRVAEVRVILATTKLAAVRFDPA